MEVIFSSKAFYFPGLIASMPKVRRNPEQNVENNAGLNGSSLEKKDLTAT
jgi:hypothetical protein